jgi:hypothetical protein
MLLYFDVTDFRDNQFVTQNPTTARFNLSESYRTVPAITLKPGVSWFLPKWVISGTILYTSEKGSKGKIYPNRNILQYLGMDVAQPFPFLLQSRYRVLLVIVGWGLAGLFVAGFTFSYKVIVQPSAILNLLVQQSLLFFSIRSQGVFKSPLVVK